MLVTPGGRASLMMCSVLRVVSVHPLERQLGEAPVRHPLFPLLLHTDGRPVLVLCVIHFVLESHVDFKSSVRLTQYITIFF